MKKPKEKKKRPAPAKLELRPGWNLGRHIRVTVTNGALVPRFLEELIVKTTDVKKGA